MVPPVSFHRFAFAAGSLLLAAGLVSGMPAANALPSAPFALGTAAGAPTRLEFAGKAVPLQSEGGGFEVRDFRRPAATPLTEGQVAPAGQGWRYTARAGELALTASFQPQADGTIAVAGEVSGQGADDRAVIVRYVVPVAARDGEFQADPGPGRRASAAGDGPGTTYPLAALTGAGWGVALSIPPSAPCCFGMTGTSAGLGVEFYLGLSPAVRASPNRAAFAFVLDAAQPGWGFRSALARYYGRYPDFYAPRIRAMGFWNWNDPVGLAPPSTAVEPGLALYTFHGVPHSASFERQLARDRRLGILTFDYTIVGMREIVGLPELPADEAAAMAVYGKFAAAWRAEAPDGPLHRKYTTFNGRNRDLPEQIETSTVGNADGKLRMRIRNSAWGANSVTFVENPNPHLFEQEHKATVGAVTLALVRDWFAHSAAPGVHLDSLGPVWPACLDYRRDHIPDVRLPLTFDKTGRVAVHNMLNHYEFIAAVDEAARAAGKYVFGNGIDIYQSRGMAEQYNGVKLGRFFLSAQLDAAGREIEDDLLTRERLEAFRTCLGRKPMTAVLYRWQNAAAVRRQMNRALAYDIWAAPNRFFGDQISYIGAPNGYARDRELLQWFAANARLLHAAGWQPLTQARTNSPDVACERFGEGDTVYFTLINLGRAPVDCELTVDMAALGLSSQDGASSFFSEIAHQAALDTATEGDTGRVKIRLAPDETHIIKLARTW